MVELLKRDNVICADTVAEGTFKTTGTLRVQGHFTGTIHAESTVTVSPTGRIMGMVSAGRAEVEGMVEGVLEGLQSLTLKKSASMNGVIVAPKLSVEPGASLIAYCAITPDATVRAKAKAAHAGSSNSTAIHTITFSFPFPQANTVHVVGDFCEWDNNKALPCFRSNNGNWSAQIQLMPGRYEYLVLADGGAHLDPTNDEKVPNSYGGQNSVITISA